MSRLPRLLAVSAALAIVAASCELPETAGEPAVSGPPPTLPAPVLGPAPETGVERIVADAPTTSLAPPTADATPSTTVAPTTTAAPTSAPTTTAVPVTTTAAPTTTAPPTTAKPAPIPSPPPTGAVSFDDAIYFNDFAAASDHDRLDHFVAYRDPFVIGHTTGASDHAVTGDTPLCGPPEQTRPQTRSAPHDHVYLCHPGGDPAKGHEMAYAMDASGYGFVGGLPDQVFEDVTQVSVDINTTSAGIRNFVEIKVIPADQVFVNGMPCGPDLPCNAGWDYDDIGAVGASTSSHEGTGLSINTPIRPDGYHFDQWNTVTLGNGDIEFEPCGSGWCRSASVHDDNGDIRARYQHVFRDNGDGTLSFGIEQSDGTFAWVTAPGAFPDGPARVVVAFHSYTGTKDGNGPGFAGNASPSQGGFTWHYDDLGVWAASARSASSHYGGDNPEHIVVPDGCIAFAQGQRNTPAATDVAPRFSCPGDTPI